MAHVKWQPRQFLIPEYELIDDMCIAALIYQGGDVVGCSYDDALIHEVTKDVTWYMFHVLKGVPLPRG